MPGEKKEKPPLKTIKVDEIAVAGKHFKVDPPYTGPVDEGMTFELDHKRGTAKLIPPPD